MTTQEYTSPGTYYWTVPAGVTSIDIVVVGAGGGGGSGDQEEGSGGGGGSAGQIVQQNSVSVTPSTSITIVIGTKGNGGTNPSGSCPGVEGGAGGSSSFGIYTATGGAGGPGSTYASHTWGFDGEDGYGSGTYASDGGCAEDDPYPGGSAGTGRGAGGGGGASSYSWCGYGGPGGAGADGYVLLTWSEPPASGSLVVSPSVSVKMIPLTAGDTVIISGNSLVPSTNRSVNATVICAPTGESVDLVLPAVGDTVDLSTSIHDFPSPAEAYLHFSAECQPPTMLTEVSGSICISGETDFKMITEAAISTVRTLPFVPIIVEANLVTSPSASITSIVPETEAAIVLDRSITPPKIFTYLDQYKWISATITRSASNPVGSLTIQIDGTSVPASGSNMNIIVKDHTGTDRCIFCGVIFDPKFYIQAGRRYASVIGYEYGFYLANQSLTEQDYVFSGDGNINNIVMYWLRGENGKWWQTTGIMPYKVLNQYSWSHDSYVPKEFVFSPNYSKADAIDEIAEYANMVFLVQTIYYQGNYCPLAYMVHADNVDDMTAGLDLPDLAWFKWPDPYVVDLNLATKSSEKINRVIVRGTNDIGVTFEYVKEHPQVTIGEMLPIELLEESKDYADSDLVEERAIYLYNKYASSAVTVEVTFKDRVDLRLYQLVQFFDFPGIPEDTMRIISISYDLTAASKTVKITATSNIDIYDIKGLDRSQSADSVTEIETIASDTVAKKVAKPEIGEIATVDGNTGTVTLERGGTISVRFLEE